jgi:predicted PurR-regulated permease PerM
MTPSQRWTILAGTVAAGFLIYLLQPMLTPFLAGALLAYLGSPLVDRLERIRVPRTAGVILVFAIIVLLIVGLVLLLIPMIGAQIEYLQRTLPQLLAWIQDATVPWIEARFGVDVEGMLDFAGIGELIAAHWRETGDIARIVAERVTRSGLAFAAFMVNVVLTPVVAFYLMRDWRRLLASLRDLLPTQMAPTVIGLARECDAVLGAFLRGQLLVMLALGAIYALGLWLVGLELALLVGLIAGALSIVPYLGTIVGIGIGLIAGMFQFGEWMPLVLIAIVFGVGNALESMVLQPWLVGDRIGLHPVAVIFAVLAGGQLFGFVGVLLALPAAAIIMVLLRHAHRVYKDSRLYGGPEADPDQRSG